jgi:SAM-dependent methyltransferase
VTEPARPVDPSEYSEVYFLTTCDGHDVYLAGGGTILAERLQALRQFLRVCPGMQVLDVGCGRGELVVHCGLGGVQATGIDYSTVGLRLAEQAIAHAESLDRDGWKRPNLALENARRLSFRDGTFDRIVMSDIVEHLYPGELSTALAEAYRVLAPGGELLIHTMPNLWYYRYGYPLFRLIQRMRGISLPADPRLRFDFSHVHVNEQTPRTLGKILAASPFSKWHVWLYDYRAYAQYGPTMRRAMRLLTGLPLVRRVFCDDIFALARK